ncbi:hypothetical protein ACH4SP_36850 [Streptomyces sp. NPDC021093]|uniref:hypothetical protein n=1 Tax=Streptomyces sp. NPDC021093 TaxID=3365112 RepID=UPI0037B3485E
MLRSAPEIGHLTVITEPGHTERYGPEVDVRLVDDVLDPASVCREALRAFAERRIDLVLSPFELGMSVAGQLRSYFGLPGIGYETANAFSHKYVMKQRMAAGGVPVAGFRFAAALRNVPEAAEELGWPVIVKPVLGGGSLDIRAFSGRAAFDEFCDSPAADSLKAREVPLIVEQFVEVLDEYHCDGIVHGGEVAFASLSRYFVPVLGRKEVFGSHLVTDEAPDHDLMRALHARTVRALGLEAGVTHMEFFRTPDGILAGEIACRLGGMGVVDAVRLQTGVDLWRGFLDTSLGLEPTVERRGGRTDTVAHLRLPMTPGRIVRLSTAEELEAVPGVLKADMKRRIGDVVPARLGSATGSGLVYFAVSDPAEIDGTVRRIHDAYEFETEDVVEEAA